MIKLSKLSSKAYQIFRSGIFLVSVEVRQIPFVCDFSRLSFPHFQVESGPKGHKNGEHHCSRVVQQVGRLHITTRVGQQLFQRETRSERLSFTRIAINTNRKITFGTNGTHIGVSCVITYLLSGDIPSEANQPVNETKDTKNGGWDQHFCVEADPSEVNGDFDAKVLHYSF